MDQMAMLWAYQKEDMKAEQLAQEMRRNPNRLQLEKDRDTILNHQKDFKRIEEELAAMADRMDVLVAALPRCEEQLRTLQDKLAESEPEDTETVAALLREATSLAGTIKDYEQELKRIAKESNTQAQRQVAIRRQAAATKQEYTKLKAVYDKELVDQKAELEKQRAEARSKAEGIDADMMERYLAIKKHVTPPIAKLYGGQCMGCNTALPSALLQKIRSSSGIVECETCGRMLYVQA